MIEQFVTYEIAIKLKELGFDEPCFKYFRQGELSESYYDRTINVFDSDIVAAPLWQQCIDWFREKGVRIYESYPFHTWSVSIKIREHEYTHEGHQFTLRQAILKAIELCQNKK